MKLRSGRNRGQAKSFCEYTNYAKYNFIQAGFVTKNRKKN